MQQLENKLFYAFFTRIICNILPKYDFTYPYYITALWNEHSLEFQIFRRGQSIVNSTKTSKQHRKIVHINCDFISDTLQCNLNRVELTYRSYTSHNAASISLFQWNHLHILIWSKQFLKSVISTYEIFIYEHLRK